MQGLVRVHPQPISTLIDLPTQPPTTKEITLETESEHVGKDFC
jgi:hypothetical protein